MRFFDTSTTLARKLAQGYGPILTHECGHILTQGYGHICLRVDDVDELYDRLVSAGASSIMPPGESPVSRVRMAFVADPEGNFIEMLDRPGPPGTPGSAS